MEKVKTSRESNSRVKETRKKDWTPPSSLDAPQPPPGYKYRWIRESILGQDDKTNMSKRIREGFEPVRAETHPEFQGPTIEDGKHAGVIGVGGLVLARIPKETVSQRSAYFRGQTQDQMDAVDNDLMREEHPSMPISQERQSRVEFGGNKKS